MKRKSNRHRKKSLAERKREDRKATVATILLVFYLFVTMGSYCAYIYFLFPPPGHLALSMLGIIGTFGLAILLSYVSYAIIYRTRILLRITLPFLSICVLLIVMSFLCLYQPFLSQLLNRNHTAIYFALWLIFAFYAICYFVFFRIPIDAWLHQVNGSRNLGSVLRIWLNKLWYRKIQEEYNLGIIYYVNILFTCTIFTAVCMHIVAGWIRLIVIVICILTGLSGLLEAVLFSFLTKKIMSDTKGKAKVLKKKERTKEMVSGNIAIIIYLLMSSIIAFGLPSVI